VLRRERGCLNLSLLSLVIIIKLAINAWSPLNAGGGVFVVVVAVDVVVIVVLVVVLVIVVVVAICTNKRCVYNKCWSPINTLVYLSNVLINSLAFITARGSDGSIVSS